MEKTEFERLEKGYLIPGNTLLYAISPRLGHHFAKRLAKKTVLECCTGAGFLTIELSKVASHVYTIEKDAKSSKAAQHNISLSGRKEHVTFICGDVFDEKTFSAVPKVEAAILDPVWGESISNMSPPLKELIHLVEKFTENIACILPPDIDEKSMRFFETDEIESLYLDGKKALLCMYKGNLAREKRSEFVCPE